MGSIYHFSGLPEVMRELSKNSNSQLKLLIVGEGEAYGDLEVFRNRYKLGDRVILTGEKDYSEIPALIATADICISPFDSIEPITQAIIPTAIYEYMAMRKPVIATRLPGVRREFGEGNGVMYVDKPKEIIKIAEDSFNSGGGFLFRLGLNGRKFVEKNSLVRVASEFEATLKDITRDKSHNS
jgi:glycosyltransferase involved in cell wall biosynthesis